MPLWKQLVILLGVSFGFFLLLQSFPAFPDPDSFYHAIISKEIWATRTPMLRFDALPYTMLDQFVDHHFLYHVLVAPFIGLIKNPFWGIKLATAVFATLAIGVFFFVLKQIRAPFPMLGALLLLIVNPFIFRLNLGKASAVSLIFLLLGVCLVRERKSVAAAVLSFWYVWLFDGWILFPFVAALYWVGESFGAIAYESRDLSFKNYFRTLSHPRILRCCAAIGIGLAFGMVVNVYFPANIHFFRDHIFRIGFLGQQATIGVGNEWLGFPFLSFLSSTAPLMALVVLAGFGFVVGFRYHQKDLFGFLTLALFFLFAVLRARRNIEYTVPAVLLWSFAVFRLPRSFFSSLVPMVGVRKWMWLSAVAAGLLVATVVIDGTILVRRFHEGIPLTAFREEAIWLQEHTAPGEIVFHSDWSEFPSLYAWNQTNRYIAGLDPRFFSFQNPNLFERWRAITQGERKNNLAQEISQFQSRFVLVSKHHTQFEENLIHNRFVKLFEGKDASIYRVPLVIEKSF